jgi:hypothetical protein
MMAGSRVLGAALIVAATFGCRVGSRDADTSAASMATGDEVVGTYFGADSGHNLGKDWCYSGALVLDSTRHFGSVIKMCGEDGGGPSTESMKGTYHLRTRTVKVAGVGRVTRVYVVLAEEGSRHKTHTLRYDNGALRFDEPWWMGAGLRALDIPDPVLKRVSAAAASDSGAVAATSSTPALAPTVLRPSSKKTASKKAATK